MDNINIMSHVFLLYFFISYAGSSLFITVKPVFEETGGSSCLYCSTLSSHSQLQVQTFDRFQLDL